ncbi:MAG: hypothetical protein ABIO63_10035 [Casimicrobiaceae bacterium]
MSRGRELADRKSRLLAEADLQRMQALLAWHDVKSIVSPPRKPSTPGSRAFGIASKLLMVAVPVLGARKARRVMRYASLGMMAFRAFRSWRG